MKNIILSLCLVAVSLQASARDFVINAGQKVGIVFSGDCRRVAHSALQMLHDDFQHVLGCDLEVTTDTAEALIVTSIDHADRLDSEWFSIEVNDGKLYITGHDSHGLAYGLLEVSRLLGVSPWEWWAECTPRHKHELRLKGSYSNVQGPRVRYRGIFINDEDWGLLPWATRQEPELAAEVLSGKYGKTSAKGIIGPKVNERIFQLMLRLRANYYWPAMHECSQPFFTIPGNREMAEKYGIYIGGSHCEPMASSTATEWPMRGKGEYNYVSNRQGVQAFWQERLDDVKNQEIVYTLGMRGLHDGAMLGTRTMDDKVRYLQMAIDDQRRMLAATLNLDESKLESVPQVFVPYKEVLDIYKQGLRVPDDVTLMWTDDNYGYIRHFPDSTERHRSGGNGIYYHTSYWGRPHDYLWISTVSPFLMRWQMSEAFSRGIRQMWILNVGDIKPAEYLVERWMDMAWHAPTSEPDEYEQLRQFMSREFGPKLGRPVAEVMSEYYRLNHIRRPEFMGGTRTEESDRTYWNQHRPIEGWTRADADRRMQQYRRLSDRVEQLWHMVPTDRRNAFFQLVKYPVQSATQMNIKFLAATKAESDLAYDSIVSLTHTYNSNPRWTGIMDMQPRRLSVFSRVEVPMQYPESPEVVKHRVALKASGRSSSIRGLGYEGNAIDISVNRPIRVDIPHGRHHDSLYVELRLLPAHPFAGERLAVSVGIEGSTPQEVEYQTYDRSEEWKRNVLRNQAVRTVVLPVGSARRSSQLRIAALTDGVVLDELYWYTK